MRCTTTFLLLSASLAAAPPASAGEAWQTAQWVGANYTAAYAVNQVQFWHDFRAKVIEREMAAAKKYFGATSLRVYLHNINFDREKATFLANIESFLKICDRNGIRPGFVFFDDCHRHKDIFLDKPTTPIKGYHNGRWAACPQDRDRDPGNIEKFKPYIQEVMRPHLKDKRVLWWEIFNEPRRSKYSSQLRKAAYRWAKQLKPTQPVMSCWNDNEATDIVDAHNYRAAFGGWDRQTDLNPAKGCVFTEAGARWYAPRPSNGEPCEVVSWLRSRKRQKKYVPGVYMCWELMVGNSNCRWYWGTKRGAPEPTVPWCGLMWPDATPVSLAEAEAVRSYVTGKSQALFFDDFQSAPAAAQNRPGWKTYGAPSPARRRVLAVPSGTKMVAGRADWTDYVLEAVVMLKKNAGSAGLIFRVNDPGPARFRGYYVGFDTKALHLGKMSPGWQPLVKFDLKGLDCKVVPGVWNQIRVAVKGGRIRVWFNRMHPSSDKARGLRIDYTDRTRPVLSGAIGVRARGTEAWFDNVVVLPIDLLPTPPSPEPKRD